MKQHAKGPKLTPMLRQYLEIKEQHQDAILFYRMGDFYEMFFDDAITASRVLGITLTSRSHKDDEHRIPMCGVPYHAASSYLGKLVKAGFRVAICEQTEDPKQAKGIVRREVVRIVTPGVTTDEQILDEKNNCFVCSLYLPQKSRRDGRAGVSYLDVSTGNFFVTELPWTSEDRDALLDEVGRMQPAELLVSESCQKEAQPILEALATLLDGLCLTSRSDTAYDFDQAHALLVDHFQTASLAGFGCESMRSGIRAAGALLEYIRETQKTDLGHIRQLRPLHRSGYLIIDESSRRNLELTETIVGGKRQGSLLSVLDLTCTPMGARLLRQRLLFPLQDMERIQARLSAIEALLADAPRRRQIRELLHSVYDLERLCSRLVLGHGNARDMTAIKVSLARLPVLKELLSGFSPGLLTVIGEQLDPLQDLHDLVESAIRDDAPVTLREGNLIREGFNRELDELLVLLRDGKRLIVELEARERERSGISKLKVGFNRVFGYYFEVSRALAADVPDYFIRKQTLANAERFITPELKELEHRISTAQERRLDLEYTLFLDLRRHLAGQSARLLDTATGIARIDFLCSLAEAAARYHYIRPHINEDDEIKISEGRHPVIERSMEGGRFVPNDVCLDQKKNGLLIITGPNMAGKSTVLRQTALIVLMAQLGSFVPAESASICLVDRIFTRVGAMDDLRRGQSTFMVEMNETANILNNATEKSLVILDEIGRGTSTYDGLAIAWAVAEDLADKNGKGVKTLFATHYHELTELAASHPRIQNYSIAVREWNDTIIFLHKLVRGATNRSYGIQVAGLAGVPDQVVRRAHEILRSIERGEFGRPGGGERKGGMRVMGNRHQPCQLSLFQEGDDPLRKLLKEVAPDDLSPRQALDVLYQAAELLK